MTARGKIVLTILLLGIVGFAWQANRAATRNKWIMFCFCAVLVIPLVAILVDIFSKAAPVLSLHYLWDNPVNKGKAGGLWAPLAGTFYLVIGSLIFVAPIGICAAIYLNEYAREGWLNRIISITVTSLAGVPSIVHGLFGVGAFVLVMLSAINRVVADPMTMDIYYLQNTLETTRSFLRKNREQALKFMRGYIEGIAYFKKNKKESLDIMRAKLRIQSSQERDVRYLEMSYNLMTAAYSDIPYPSLRAVQSIVDKIAEEDPKVKEREVRSFVDDTLVKELEDSGFTKSLYGR
jgi:hypothetical protein